MLKADGLYISANNKNLNASKYKYSNYKIIGGAHNIKEINLKKKQGCSEIFFHVYLLQIINIKKVS